MRTLAPFLFAACLSLSPAAAFAQQAIGEPSAPSVQEEEDQAEAREAISLDQLFADLKKQANPQAADRIARQIWQMWNSSGSETVDLLMGWAAKAMREENHALAESVLNHVVTLAPDYAEGWNRRATLFYSVNDYTRSLSDIERTLQLEPRHFGALSGLGTILQKTEQKRAALQAWKRVLEVYPANRDAQKTFIRLEDEVGGEGI
jgi:tetratricopeptide (TPR) repeat protein